MSFRSFILSSISYFFYYSTHVHPYLLLELFRINLLCQSYLLFKLFVSLPILPVILFFFTFTLYLIIPNNNSLTYTFHLNFNFLITQQVYLSYLLNNLLFFYFLSFPFSSSNTSNLFFYFIFFIQPTDTNLLLCISISIILSILFIDFFTVLLLSIHLISLYISLIQLKSVSPTPFVQPIITFLF